MRVFLTIAALLVAVAPLSAQPKDKDKPAEPPKSRVVLADLQQEIKSADFTAAPLKFGELLTALREQAQTTGKVLVFAVDDEAYREDNADATPILNEEIRLRNLPQKTTIGHVLRQALKQLPVKSAMVIRAGRVDIVPQSRTSKEYMLNQTFHVDFADRRLDAALEDLSELTGVSIVVDSRTKQKIQTTVTARFHDDVALQDAVRMLTDMAELKIVYLVTGIYVTTPEHAREMQKELKDLYEPKLPPPAGGIGVPGGVAPGAGMPDPFYDPQQSPLAPPLPPARRRPEAGA
jgi:hypothetical protein